MRTMTLDIAKQVAKNIKEINKTIKHINAGGCGTFACLFAEAMKAKGFSPVIVELAFKDPDLISLFTGATCEYYEKNHNANSSNIHQVATTHGTPTHNKIHMADHYAVNIDGFYFDSTLMKQKDATGDVLLDDGNDGPDLFEIIGDMSLKDMEYISVENRGDIWNDMYDDSQTNALKEDINNAVSFLSIN